MVYATIRQAKDAAEQVAGNGDVNGGLNGQLNGQLNDSQKETFEFIKAHEGYNTTKIADVLGKPFRTIVKHINVLLELNMIERREIRGRFFVPEEIEKNKKLEKPF